MADSGVIVQSTGGYNSSNNGQVEVGQRQVGKVIRSSLIAAGLPDKLWIMRQAAERHNLSWNSGKKCIPLHRLYEELGVKKKRDYNSLIILGSKLYSVACPMKKKLEPCSSKDPRNYSNLYLEPDSLLLTDIQ